MAVVLGNLAPLLDLTSPRTIIITDRKSRPVSSDVILNLPKRDLHVNYSALANKSFDSEGDSRNHRVVTRGKSNSKVNGVDFDAGSSDEENGNGEEEYDWDKEMRKRLKEIEEMRELEKKAEEIQNRVEDDVEAEAKEETEEEKKMRVRRELEKVHCLCYVIKYNFNPSSFIFEFLLYVL